MKHLILFAVMINTFIGVCEFFVENYIISILMCICVAALYVAFVYWPDEEMEMAKPPEKVKVMVETFKTKAEPAKVLESEKTLKPATGESEKTLKPATGEPEKTLESAVGESAKSPESEKTSSDMTTVELTEYVYDCEIITPTAYEKAKKWYLENMEMIRMEE